MNMHSPVMEGDSGGPIFKLSTGARNTTTAKVFGIIILAIDNTRALYEPVDKIMSELNLRLYH